MLSKLITDELAGKFRLTGKKWRGAAKVKFDDSQIWGMLKSKIFLKTKFNILIVRRKNTCNIVVMLIYP